MKFLSIIIPAFNSQESLPRLLSSIQSSQKVKFDEIEIIVVDDASLDKTVQVAAKPRPKDDQPLANRIIALKRNEGPAKARNIGVKYAKGKIVLFLDADVVLFQNTLYEVISSFKNDPDLFALTGVWTKEQKSAKFFPKFKALRDWSYWINERDPKNYYYLFSTRIAAINRDLFLRLGGFDTTYKAALIEDIELTYRIARRYAVVFNPKVRVRHEFEDFFPIAKKYFWRSYYWSKLYRKRRKFDPVATTSKEALTTISAGSAFFMAAISIVLTILGLYHLYSISVLLVLFLLLLHLWGVRKFLTFVFKEEGIVFAVKSFFIGIILYLVILAGAAYSMAKQDRS